MPTVMLSDVEVMVGFLATSIATYRPLYRRIFQGTGAFSTGYSANKRSGFADDFSHPTGHTTNISRNRNLRSQSGESQHGIIVTDQIELIRHHNVDGSWLRINNDLESGSGTGAAI